MIIKIVEGEVRHIVVAQGVGGPQGPIGPIGPEGPQGEQGIAGQATIIRGTFGISKTPADLPDNGFLPADWDGPGRPLVDSQAQEGESMMYQPLDQLDPLYGHVFTWTPTTTPIWSDLGSWVGPVGPPGGADDFVDQTGDTMTGDLFLFYNDTTTVLRNIDSSLTGRKASSLESDDVLQLKGPTVLIDSNDTKMSMAGGQQGSLLVVTDVTDGVSSLGYQAPIQSAYSVVNTTQSPKTIKVGGALIDPAWIDLGLLLVPTVSVLAGSATILFNIPLNNPTTRTGTVEFGLRVNSTDFNRDITMLIPANFDGKASFSIPLLNAYEAGDFIRLQARVTENNNNAFSLTMDADASDLAVFKISSAETSDSPGGFPIGSVIDFAGTTEPSGWVFAFGQEVSRDTYSALFNAIGTTYGAGNGTTSFLLPDLRGRVIAGQDDMGGSSANRLTLPSTTIGGINGDTLGGVGGSELHTITEAQMPAHSHSYYNGRGGVGYTGGANSSIDSSLGTDGTSTGSKGAGTAHNNVQPTIIMNKIIKF